MTLTKHENLTFSDAAVHVSGHAYIGCKFVRCTLMISDLPFMLNGNHFENCNWHFDCLVLWGDKDTRSRLRLLLDLIDGSGDMNIRAE